MVAVWIGGRPFLFEQSGLRHRQYADAHGGKHAILSVNGTHEIINTGIMDFIIPMTAKPAWQHKGRVVGRHNLFKRDISLNGYTEPSADFRMKPCNGYLYIGDMISIGCLAADIHNRHGFKVFKPAAEKHQNIGHVLLEMFSFSPRLYMSSVA